MRCARGACAGRASLAHYDALRVPPGRAAAADVLLRGPGRLLPRHPEGPALHDGARQSRARRSRADRAVAHHATRCCADGADPSFTAEEAWQILHPEASASDLRRRPGTTLPAVPDATALLAQLGAHPRGARDGAEGARGAARSGQDRLVAAGRGRRSPRRRETMRALASLGDDLRFVLITSAATRGGAATRLAVAVDAEPRTEVRALLALARRRRRRPGAPDDLRPLRRATCSARASRGASPDARRARRASAAPGSAGAA